jgi:GGDEF domain-containing protein
LALSPAGTTSIEIGAAEADSPDLGGLMRAADIALYRAKRGGRDRAEMTQAGSEPAAKTLENV